MSRWLGEASGASDVTAMPLPTTVISCHPTCPCATSAVASNAAAPAVSAVRPHSSRVVGRPPSPSGNATSAEPTDQVTGPRSVVATMSEAADAQRAVAQASDSIELTVPSPSTSMAERSWNVGISARSSTWSTAMLSALTVKPT